MGSMPVNRGKRKAYGALLNADLDPAYIYRHMPHMLIETEPTPNPSTLKFLPGRIVMEQGTRDFADPEEASASPLASALFSIGDVSGVFFGKDFVSVTLGPGSSWSQVKPDVLTVLLDHFSSEAPLFAGGHASEIEISDDDFADDPEDADIIVQIKDLIETRVRPAVARDGGDIVYRGFQRGTVFLAMHGACSGCPSSTATLKNGIETLLKHYVPEVTEVRAI